MTGSPHVSLDVHVCTPCPEHCVAPGVQAPVLLHWPFMHEPLGHAIAAPRLPVGSHVCTPAPLHTVEPGTHVPAHAPLTHAEAAHATPAPQTPAAEHVCTSLPPGEQRVALGAHDPVHVREARRPGRPQSAGRAPGGRRAARPGRRCPCTASLPPDARTGAPSGAASTAAPSASLAPSSLAASTMESTRRVGSSRPCRSSSPSSNRPVAFMSSIESSGASEVESIGASPASEASTSLRRRLPGGPASLAVRVGAAVDLRDGAARSSAVPLAPSPQPPEDSENSKEKSEPIQAKGRLSPH